MRYKQCLLGFFVSWHFRIIKHSPGRTDAGTSLLFLRNKHHTRVSVSLHGDHLWGQMIWLTAVKAMKGRRVNVIYKTFNVSGLLPVGQRSDTQSDASWDDQRIRTKKCNRYIAILLLDYLHIFSVSNEIWIIFTLRQLFNWKHLRSYERVMVELLTKFKSWSFWNHWFDLLYIVFDKLMIFM